jgi:hypothetical protein
MMMRAIALLLILSSAGLAQPPKASFEGRPAYKLTNGKLELIVLEKGTSFASLILTEDGEKMNPMWEPIRMAREAGQQGTFGESIGHFVCVDGFGGTSQEERAAGLQGHGEAHRQTYQVKSFDRQGGVTSLELTAELPILRENFTRIIRMVDGENVVYVNSRLESLLGFDRPAVWAEHATIGAPFLEPGVTVVDMPAVKAQTRPYNEEREGRLPHRLPSGVDFTWPNAPAVGGGSVDVRAAPKNPNSGDHTTSLMDPSRKFVFVTALHPNKRLLLGYIFRAADFPWIQSWEYYPADGRLARGLEFSTQPYDVPRREAVQLGSLFGAPSYRWLPAKSAIDSVFLMFYTRTPEGFTRVDDVQLENKRILIYDRTAGKQLALAASLEP